MQNDQRYEVVVVGGGHAGVEAAWAAAGLGARTALVTMDPTKIGVMSCNPAIGGLAKGQMVREVDALGGLMGRAIDATGIQFRTLNRSKGAAVQAPRAQADKYLYAAEVQRLIASRPIEVISATVDSLIIENGRCVGIVSNGQTILANAVVMTTGTFMRSLMHTGRQRTRGGRAGEGSAEGMSAELRRLGFELGRLKTGTPPRLAAETIDFSGLVEQWGDETIEPFSEMSPSALPAGRFPTLRQICCHMTETNAAIHNVIRANLDQAPMYSGQIEAECGPRYCPSIEDKVVRFADRSSHHVFLEPESLNTNEIYCNGISTSLPAEVQDVMVRQMRGCEKAVILRHGYAVEYDMVWPHQIDSTCMTKRVEGLFLAGQINGTSGYEEAAGQGLVAGLNAVRLLRGESLIRPGRESSYIGVMLDDLVTKTPREPYRMFTSRAEHRLILRGDTAPDRLTPMGRQWGLVCDDRWSLFERRRAELGRIDRLMRSVQVEGMSLREHVRRRSAIGAEALDVLARVGERVDSRLAAVAQNNVLYEGYVQRQANQIARMTSLEGRSIPEGLDYGQIQGLRSEAAVVLARFQPTTLGQAQRLAGVNPADVTLVEIALRRGLGRRESPTVTNRAG